MPDDNELNEHHQMDTNGFTHHVELRMHAEKRLMTSLLAYCGHVADGDHASCPTFNCIRHQGLMDAYRLFLST